METAGDGAHGIFVISQGGFGGILQISGNGGNAGNSDDVSVDASGIISTSGDGAHGIVAQSLGGAGQFLAISGSGGNGGGAGTVNVDSKADITTAGAASHGIFVTSSGGRGADLSISGNGGNGGNGGDVSIMSSGTIMAGGVGSHGIFASSTGGAGGFLAISGAGGAAGAGGAVDITIAGGSVTGGTGAGTGVQVDAGTTVILNNAGMIASLSGNALNLTGQSVTVENHGTIDGNVTLNGIAGGTFNNNAGGTFNSGDTIALGSGMLTNAGTLSPGGKGTVKTTELTGELTQTPGGKFEADVDLKAGAADLLTVTGAAALSGQVASNIVSFDSAAFNAPITILTATGGVTDNGLSVTDTLLVDYELLYPDANTVALTMSVNFLGAVAGLTPNQTAVVSNLNAILGTGVSLPVMAALLNITSVDELSRLLDQLTPAGDAAQISSAMKTGNAFAGQLLSCKTLGEGDPNAFIREGQCLWVRANVRHLDNDGRNGETGFAETATFYSAGAQFDVGGPWRIGAGIGFEDGDVRTGSNAQSETERLHVGGVIKYNPGPLLLAASLTGGHGWSDNTRVISFGGFSDVATSDSDQSFISGRLTGAYLLNRGHWYLKPQIDLAWTHLERDGYTETSSGGSALTVAGSDDTVFSVSPSVELGAEYALAFGGVARPYVKGGVTWVDSDTFITSAAFAGVPGAAGFTIETTIDDVVADLGLGVDFLAESGTVLRVQYDAQFGDQTEQHGGSAKLSVPF